MKSAIYNYTLDTLAAKEIEQAIYEGTVKIRVLPIKPSEPRGSCDDTYKLMLNQHVICTETTETKCLAQAMEIVSNNLNFTLSSTTNKYLPFPEILKYLA